MSTEDIINAYRKEKGYTTSLQPEVKPKPIVDSSPNVQEEVISKDTPWYKDEDPPWYLAPFHQPMITGLAQALDETADEIVKTGELPWYLDVPLGAGVYAGTAAALAPSGPGVLATSAIAAPVYMATKSLLTGKLPQPSLVDMIPGSENINPTVLGTAEEMAMWTLPIPTIKYGAKAIGGTLKRLSKGVDLVTKPTTKILTPITDQAWNIIKIPTKIPLGKKTIAERLQRGVERLEDELPDVAKAFRRVEAEGALTKQLGRDLGKRLQTESPDVVREVSRKFRQKHFLQGVTNPRAKQILLEFEGSLKELSLNKQYEKAFKQSFRKMFPQPFKVAGKEMKETMKVFTTPEGTSVRGIHKVLRNIMHSDVDDGVKILAKDLWNLPVQTPAKVADASVEASFEYMTQQIKRLPGAVSPYMKKDYIVSNFGKLKGAIIHKDIELELQALKKLPSISQGAYNKYFMTPWKTNKVVLRPASHIRNTISNVILNDWGGLPFYRMDIYIKALRDMKQGDLKWKEFKRLTGLTATNFSHTDIGQLDSGLKFGANIFEKMLGVYDKIVAPARGLYNAEESLFKYAKYLHNIENKMDKVEAATDALKWTFNFGEITPEVAQIGKWAIPFVRWFSKIIPLGCETAVKHPVRFGKWIAAGMEFQSYAFENVGVDEEEWEGISKHMPEYMQKGLYLMMPWRDDKERLNMLDLTFVMPFIGDVSEMMQRSPIEQIVQNPIFTSASTVLSKKKFSGAPLYYDWEPAGSKLFKTFAYGWGQLMPPGLPGGADYERLDKAFKGGEDASLSVEQAVASTLGFRLVPIDYYKNLRRKTAILNIYNREMKGQLRKDLKVSSTEEETQRILEKYRGYKMKVRK